MVIINYNYNYNYKYLMGSTSTCIWNVTNIRTYQRNIQVDRVTRHCTKNIRCSSCQYAQKSATMLKSLKKGEKKLFMAV